MAADRALRLIDTMLDALVRERELLIAGDFALLERAAADRERQNARLAALGAELSPREGRRIAPMMQRLRTEALRNGELLGAALQGAAAGRRRLEEILEAHHHLRGYDASGQPVDRSGPADLGRRA
ncbi:MAG: hypothetical protein ACFCUS_10590 [Rubrimonas sp.]|uniref:hypothetical protein n=1 Tax=Rubrimonas sp. TaxID=2036015 RepID=UPI002FDD411C